MLGKTANGIFWMYRLLERAENTARLIETGQRTMTPETVFEILAGDHVRAAHQCLVQGPGIADRNDGVAHAVVGLHPLGQQLGKVQR